jgi:cobalt-zinc-cadmium efflux system outer membrane protein
MHHPIRCCLVLLAATAGCARAAASQCEAELNLAQVEARVTVENADVLLARNAIDAARADLTTAGERPNPTLSLNSSSYDVRKGLGPGDALHKQSDTILRLDQPIERGGKRGLRVDAARAGLTASEADYAEQKRESLQTVRIAFFALLHAQQKLEVDREIDDLQQQTLAAAERRQKAGDLSSSDFARLKVEALKASNDRQRAEADQRAARSALAVLIGCAADSPFAAAAGSLPAPVEAIVQIDDAMKRPDVAAAQARELQAQKALDLARAQRVRDISIGVQLEHYPNGVPTPGDGQVLAGVGISVPLFLFNHYDGEIARAGADAEASHLQLTHAQAMASADLEAAREALDAAAAVVTRYRDSILPQAQAAADAVEYAYMHGAAPLLDLLDGRRTLRATRIELTDAEYDYAASLAGWQAASDRYTPSTELAK